jgi:hypothetical protein
LIWSPAIRFALACVLGLGLPLLTRAESRTDEQKIAALLEYVAAQKDVEFIRNGSVYESATAAKFLRAKLKSQRAEVKTVGDFIEKIATKSSTTGQAYRIRFKDGHEIDCADFLRRRLGELTPN